MKEDRELSTAVLRRRFRNARTTYRLALGHTKAAGNKREMEHYATLLRERGIDAHADKRKGIYNGIGAW